MIQMDFNPVAEIVKELDRQIENAKADVYSALNFLNRISGEIETKLGNYAGAPELGFSQDLNVGKAAADLQAATSALAALVGQKANISAVVDFSERNDRRKKVDAIELHIGDEFMLGGQSFAVATTRPNSAGEVQVRGDHGNGVRKSMKVEAVKNALFIQ